MPVGVAAGEYRPAGGDGPAAGVPGSGPAGARESAPHPGRGRRSPGGAGCLHPAFQSHELPLRPGGKAHPAGEALPKAAGIGALLPGAGEHLRGGAGGGGGHRPAGDLFRLVPAPVLLRHAGAPDPVCRAGPCQFPGGGGAVPLRAPDPPVHCGGTAVGQEAPVQILGPVHRPGGHVPGGPAGPDHLEDLPGRRPQAGADGGAGRAL